MGLVSSLLEHVVRAVIKTQARLEKGENRLQTEGWLTFVWPHTVL